MDISQNNRIQGLDILRAVAVLLVLGRHLFFIPESLPQLLIQPLLLWHQIGWVGVDLFFVLSGFLVSGLLFSEWKNKGSLKLGRFLIRRAFKIYPSFYIMLLVTYALSNSDNPEIPNRLYLYEALFIQNYLGGIWNHTWSLAVEEHFYLFLALLFFLITVVKARSSNPFSLLPKLVFFVGAQLLLIRLYIAQANPPGQWKSTLSYSHLRFDSLLFGVLISYYYHFFPRDLAEKTRKFCVPLIFTMISAWIFPSIFALEESRLSYSFGFTALYLGFGALLLLTLLDWPQTESQSLRYAARLLVPIGKASYSIYLWHMVVYQATRTVFLTENPTPTTPQFLAHLLSYLLGSVVLGCAMFRLVETPFLSLRQRWFP